MISTVEKNKSIIGLEELGGLLNRGGLQFNSIKNSFKQEFKEVRKLALQISSGVICQVEGTSVQKVLYKNAIVAEGVEVGDKIRKITESAETQIM